MTGVGVPPARAAAPVTSQAAAITAPNGAMPRVRRCPCSRRVVNHWTASTTRVLTAKAAPTAEADRPAGPVARAPLWHGPSLPAWWVAQCHALNRALRSTCWGREALRRTWSATLGPVGVVKGALDWGLLWGHATVSSNRICPGLGRPLLNTPTRCPTRSC